MTMSEPAVALPPSELIHRIGDDPGDTVDRYLEIGKRHRELVESYLPRDWAWTDKTYLDWGSGAGRLIRHFMPEAATNRIIATDIDEPSIAWINANLAPIEGIAVAVEPGIPLADESVDLVTGFSVMTHITDHWAGWLLEIRRILRPGGRALFSTCGADMIPALLQHPAPIDAIGMLVVKYGNPWAFGGPTVLHSPWWVRAHWGRAFEVVRIDERALRGERHGHDLVLMRRPAGPPPTVAELEEREPGEPREIAALVSALQQTRAELAELRGDYERVQHDAYVSGLVADDRALQLEYIRGSRSWRLTRPIRRLGSRLRGRADSTLE
jgi:SAM-dependent methyltransferase